MDLTEVMRTTAAVRRFTDRLVDDVTLYRLLDDARFAPSGGNAQGWHVVVVRDPETRRRVGQLCDPVWQRYLAEQRAGHRPFNPVRPAPGDLAPLDEPVPHPLLSAMAEVPALLVVTVDLAAVAVIDAGLDRPGVVGGASIYPFVHNLLLGARNAGLGGVLMTFLAGAEPEAKALLHLPDSHAVAAVVVLGEPEHQPTRLSRKPVEEFTTVDRYDGATFHPPAPRPGPAEPGEELSP